MEIHCQRDNDLLENVTSSLSRPMSSRKTMKRLKSGKMPSTKDPFDLPAHRPTDPQTATTYCGAQSYIGMNLSSFHDFLNISFDQLCIMYFCKKKHISIKQIPAVGRKFDWDPYCYVKDT